ncbi:MAG: hypothetical protein HRT35_17975 [Algicola sp.]|nr:hypothetical protein [Algicola sp.]
MIYFAKTPSDEIETTLAHQQSLSSGTYRLECVWQQLAADFHGKCYLCGDKAKSPRIEHFKPQVLGQKFKFDWNNLFLSCEHCNAIKSDSYHQLIDCTTEYPDRHIRFAVRPMGAIGSRVTVQQLPESDIHGDTVELLSEIYSGTTTCKQIGAQAIVDDLLDELNDFEDLLKVYLESQDEDDLNELIWEMNNRSKFTAFKRELIKSNALYRTQFVQYFSH